MPDILEQDIKTPTCLYWHHPRHVSQRLCYFQLQDLHPVQLLSRWRSLRQSRQQQCWHGRCCWNEHRLLPTGALLAALPAAARAAPLQTRWRCRAAAPDLRRVTTAAPQPVPPAHLPRAFPGSPPPAWRQVGPSFLLTHLAACRETSLLLRCVVAGLPNVYWVHHVDALQPSHMQHAPSRVESPRPAAALCLKGPAAASCASERARCPASGRPQPFRRTHNLHSCARGVNSKYLPCLHSYRRRHLQHVAVSPYRLLNVACSQPDTLQSSAPVCR